MKLTGNYLIIHTDKNAPEQRVTAQDENGRALTVTGNAAVTIKQ